MSSTLAANLYCHQGTERMVLGALPAVRNELKRQGQGVDFWFLRYGKAGEHLKLRLRGEDLEPLRPQLQEALQGALEKLPPAQKEQKERKRIPPLDRSDTHRGLHEDRRLVWTEDFTTPVLYGGEPYLEDPETLERMRDCFARSSEFVLDTYAASETGTLSVQGRQSALLEGLIFALAALPENLRLSYLAYHRDHLLRSTTARRGQMAEYAHELLSRIRETSDQVASTLPSIRKMTEDAWQPKHEGAPAFAHAVRNLLQQVQTLEPPSPDPFAESLLFVPLFKVCSVLANQIGLQKLSEAFIHHLLLRSLEPEEAIEHRIVLLPGIAPPMGVPLHHVLASEAPHTAKESASQTEFSAEEASEDLFENYDWATYLHKISSEGKAWFDEFLSDENRALANQFQQGLTLLRSRRFDEGRKALEEAAEALEKFEGRPSIGKIHERRKLGAEAYLHFAVGDLDRAAETMASSTQPTVEAIEIDPFLHVAATDCLDGSFQLLRIHRSRRNWQAMWEQIYEIGEMLREKKPLCTLTDGTEIGLKQIRETFEPLMDQMSEQEQRRLRGIFDPEFRLFRFSQIAWEIYALPGQMIPFP